MSLRSSAAGIIPLQLQKDNVLGREHGKRFSHRITQFQCLSPRKKLFLVGAVLMYKNIDLEGGFEMNYVKTAPLLKRLEHRLFTDVIIGFDALEELLSRAVKWLDRDIGILGKSHCTVRGTGHRSANGISNAETVENIRKVAQSCKFSTAIHREGLRKLSRTICLRDAVWPTGARSFPRLRQGGGLASLP